MFNAKASLYLILITLLLTNFVFAQSLQESVLSLLCGIVGFVRAIVGVLAVVLFILGGVLYAVGHFLPATGNLRASIQGWAMGMLFAGVVAVVIYIIAVPLVSVITGLGAAAGSDSVSYTCSSSGVSGPLITCNTCYYTAPASCPSSCNVLIVTTTDNGPCYMCTTPP